MLAIILGALVARRAQALAVFLLAILASAGASAAPMYVAAAGQLLPAEELAAAEPLARGIRLLGPQLQAMPGETTLGDGTLELPPEVLADFPPGTMFAVDHTADTVTLTFEPLAEHGRPRSSR